MTLHKAANVNVQNKVVLTQAQKKAIEILLKDSYYTREVIVNHHAKDNLQRWDSGCEPLNGMPLETLIIALYRPEDITIKQTVEEQLLEFYKKQKKEDPTEQVHSWFAVEIVLNIIGMKVKGINA